MKRIALASIIIILVVLIIGSSFVYLSMNKPASAALEKVTIGNVPVESYAMLWIAEKQGFFADNGLDVTVKDYSTGATAVEALINGEIDVGGSSDYVVMLYAFQKANISIITSCAESEFFELICRNDHGITNISDLNGKTIGGPKSTVASFYLGLFLEENGTSMQDITLVDLAPNEIANAISNGTVDAVVSWELYTEQVKAQIGTDYIEWSLQEMDVPFYGVLSCRNDWIPEHTQTLNRLLTALTQAEDYLNSNQTQAQQILKERFNYTDSYIATIWSRTTFGLSLPQRLPEIMQQEAAWMIDNSITTQTELPNVANYIHTGMLKVIKPESVTIP